MKKSLVILALVAGCGASDHGNNQAATAPVQGRAPAAPAVAPVPARPSDAPGLAGLYQSGNAAQPNQLCIADKGDSTQFGLTVWGPNMAACSGAGLARMEGGKLTLTMTGDSACAISAEMKDGKVVLPTKLPQGCGYYCGKGAAVAGTNFVLKEAGAAGAAKAKDPAGDPLCG
ncbi:MAG TPA: hypothetical protein VGC56_08710 [Allosphingosinicella sp.]|jgi:hypothetical protein